MALIADIEKAFLTVSVLPVDRDVLRFLWVDDTGRNPKEVIYRFCCVVFDVTSNPFSLRATLEFGMSTYLKDDPKLAKRTIDSL